MERLGWVKLHRAIIDSPLYKDSNAIQRDILITLLLSVNHKPNKWIFKGEEYEVKEGQLITSLESIAKSCSKGTTIQNVRTALKKFEKYNFLTNEPTNKNRLITIVNWGLYQQGNEELTNNLTGNQQATNKQLTSNQQATNKQLTTNKNDKNNNNDNKDKKEEKDSQINSISFPSSLHKDISNYLGEVAYKTWFDKSLIEDTGTEIKIKAEPFTLDVIEKNYKGKLSLMMEKEILLEVTE